MCRIAVTSESSESLYILLYLTISSDTLGALVPDEDVPPPVVVPPVVPEPAVPEEPDVEVAVETSISGTSPNNDFLQAI